MRQRTVWLAFDRLESDPMGAYGDEELAWDAVDACIADGADDGDVTLTRDDFRVTTMTLFRRKP